MGQTSIWQGVPIGADRDPTPQSNYQNQSKTYDDIGWGPSSALIHTPNHRMLPDRSSAERSVRTIENRLPKSSSITGSLAKWNFAQGQGIRRHDGECGAGP